MTLQVTSSSRGPRTLNVNTTAVGNVGGGTDDLISYAVAGGTLVADGDRLKFTAAVTWANNANAKTLTVVFGSDTYLTSAITAGSAGDGTVQGEIIRTGAATCEVIMSFVGKGGAAFIFEDYATGTPTFANANTLKLTGAATSNDDIVQQTLTVEYWPAA